MAPRRSPGHDGTTVERRRVRVTGTVQGVGFRPFVYREATALGLAGYVANDSLGVLIEVEGPGDGIDELCRRLAEDAPPMARVSSVSVVPLAPIGAAGVAGVAGRARGFHIVASRDTGSPDVPVSVDVATCDDCLAELVDPADRRYRYPFVNCTNCGPRYTIVRRVPYDRPSTTMAGFTMCPACQAEYDDPADRRFHAQPNACPACGPHLLLCAPDGTPLAERDDALDGAVRRLLGGAILAIKGVGGFHLACDATDTAAVVELRRRKSRDEKPFALMVPSLDAARALCVIGNEAAAALASPRRPIVLAPRRRGAAVAPGIAPGLPELGVMLPYTPLHHLLLAGVHRPLVMTSGNLSDEPIAHDDADAFARLGPLVDAVLTHDRPIHIRCDDSVVRAAGGHLQLARRSRGYAPEPVTLPVAAARPVLALGAELKSTVTVARGSTAVTSHHIGDLEHLATYRSFLQAVEHLCHLFGIEPEVVVHDLHPEYLSTKLALELDLPLLGVQHHHAHVASCLVEHGRTEPVVGLALDGTGLGTDGVLWGCEALVADLTGFERAGHLREAPLPGGATAIAQPWRMAVSWLTTALGPDTAARHGRELGGGDATDAVVALTLSGRSPRCTGTGRLFDAVAALLGIRGVAGYEGQAAIELEAAARLVRDDDAPVYPVDVRAEHGAHVLDPAPMLAALVDGLERGVEVPVLAAGFHAGFGRGAARLAEEIAATRGLDTVALTGGSFQNARLTEVVTDALVRAGLQVLRHGSIPPNDGGISIGQAAIAAAMPMAPLRHPWRRQRGAGGDPQPHRPPEPPPR